jgi:hypothetical protein
VDGREVGDKREKSGNLGLYVSVCRPLPTHFLVLGAAPLVLAA